MHTFPIAGMHFWLSRSFYFPTAAPTLMDKLTPAEAAMKPAAKPTPAPKKKSILKKPLPLINISATQRVIGGTVRISNAVAELRRASAAKKVDRDAAAALVDTDDE